VRDRVGATGGIELVEQLTDVNLTVWGRTLRWNIAGWPYELVRIERGSQNLYYPVPLVAKSALTSAVRLVEERGSTRR
jgi:hypothetical protein